MIARGRAPHEIAHWTVAALSCWVLATPHVAGQAPATAPYARAQETALDRYVAAPDPHFHFDVVGMLPAEGATATLLNMTSQQWLTTTEVEQPIWRHWLTVITPPTVRTDLALLFITGGSNERPQPSSAPAPLVAIARSTGAVVAELRLVPNQPVVFQDDPAKTPRVEDDLIAYTWDKFLRTGDERWPARLPMTKSAVRAMDAVTAFAASGGGGHRVSRFVVAGASKRGWTTWTTAVVDTRVAAIAPIVIDLLNIEASMKHHWRAYGAWAEAIKDYVGAGIMNWLGTPEFRALMRIVEPYEYRSRLTIPKLILNASGDEFFLPDSSQFYRDGLRGETHLRYVPNTGHSLEGTDAYDTVHAFFAAVVQGTPRPVFSWTFESDGSIRVVAKDRPRTVVLWQATNPSARDFRLSTIGRAYRSTTLVPVGPNTWQAQLAAPVRGWTAGFVELTFDSADGPPLKLTTAVRVLPDTLPYPDFVPIRPARSRVVRPGVDAQGSARLEAR